MPRCGKAMDECPTWPILDSSEGNPMKINVTVDELIAAWGPKIRSMPSTKPRDPVERELLRRLGDPNVARENDACPKTAGERTTPGDGDPRT